MKELVLIEVCTFFKTANESCRCIVHVCFVSMLFVLTKKVQFISCFILYISNDS